MSQWVLNNFRGEYSFSLGSLLQCSVTLTAKNFFLPIQMELPEFIVCAYCPLSCFWAPVMSLALSKLASKLLLKP